MPRRRTVGAVGIAGIAGASGDADLERTGSVPPSDRYPGVVSTDVNWTEGNHGGDLAENDLITGEAVALSLPPASLGMRALSGALDIFLNATVISTVALIALNPLLKVVDVATAAVISVVLTVSLLVALPTAMEAITGRTLAKMMLGLRTLRDDGGPIGFRHAFTRQLITLIEVYPLMGSPALICGLFNNRSKRLGDLAAGTYVVKDRMNVPWPKQGAIPPQLEHWARTSDIAPLPDQLSLSIRELLSRAPHIRPEPRLQLAQSLAGQAVTYVSPGPPVGTPPEVFLETLLVERGRRDYARLQREEALRRRLTGQHHAAPGPMSAMPAGPMPSGAPPHAYPATVPPTASGPGGYGAQPSR